MRRIVAASAGVLVVSGAIACTQLFHATDFATLCDIDAAACQAPDAGEADVSTIDASLGPFDFCKFDRAQARQAADRACGLLGACSGPFGGNAAGLCLVDAIKVFDCQANPDLRPVGAAETYWSCIARATTCEQIEACVFGGPRQACGTGGFLGCTADGRTRVDCSNPPLTGAESCAARGQKCVRYAADSLSGCTGARGRTCAGDGCEGTSRVACSDAGSATVDLGEDCALWGAGKCATGPEGALCVPSGSTVCSASRCDGTKVQRCANNRRVTLDCAAFGMSCNDSIGGALLVAGCSPQVPDCTVDACAGSALAACVNRQTLTINCEQLGLGPCKMVETETPGTLRPACTKK